MSAAFSVVAEFSMLSLGSHLKRKENISARLGDILSYCFLGSLVLKYYSDTKSDEDTNFMHWSLTYCLSEIQRSFDGLFENFPSRWMGWCLRRFIFPFGAAYSPVPDASTHALATSMQRPSKLRDRLTQLCYLGGKDNSLADLEFALKKVIAAEGVQKKLHKAMKGKHAEDLSMLERLEKAIVANILTPQEVAAVHESIAAVKRAIKVDEFEAKT